MALPTTVLTPWRGSKTYINVARQTAFGTPAAATAAAYIKLEVIDITIDGEQGQVADPSLNSTGRTPRSILPVGRIYRGKFRTRANYSGHGTLFKAFYGNASWVTAAGPPVTATFVESPNGSDPYTIEVFGGIAGSSTVGIMLSDVTITGVTIRCEAGTSASAALTYEWTFIATTLTTSRTMTSASGVPTVEPVLFHHVTTTQDAGFGDGANISGWRSLEINYNFPFDESRYFFGYAQPFQPYQNGLGTCSWKLGVEVGSQAAYTAFAAAATTNAPVIRFGRTASGTVPGVGPSATTPTTGAANNYIQFSSSYTLMTKVSTPVTNYGLVTGQIEYTCGYSSTDSAAMKTVIASGDTETAAA